MIEKRQIENLVTNYLENSDNYLIEVSIKAGNNINVLLESDTNISIQNCIDVSRHIESTLDRDKDDFELNVSSAGIDRPFKVLRQYYKNIGKTVKVTLLDGKLVKGKLQSVDENEIIIIPQSKKSKEKIEAEAIRLGMSDIKETKLIITF